MISVQLSSYSNPAVSAVYDYLWPHGETGTAGYRTTFISCLVSLPAALSLSPCLPFLGSYCLPVFTSSCPQTLCVSSAFFQTAGGVKEGRWEESITPPLCFSSCIYIKCMLMMQIIYMPLRSKGKEIRTEFEKSLHEFWASSIDSSVTEICKPHLINFAFKKLLWERAAWLDKRQN